MKTERHVLITGGAGYIGSLLTSELLRANYRVTVVDNLLFGGKSLVGFLHHPNFHFAKADVTEPHKIKDVVRDHSASEKWPKPDALVHLAAIVGFPACQAVGKQVAWKYNVEATKMVFEQASDLGAERFVFSSTYSNYGLSSDGKPVTENRRSRHNPCMQRQKLPLRNICLTERRGMLTFVVSLCNVVRHLAAHTL